MSGRKFPIEEWNPRCSDGHDSERVRYRANENGHRRFKPRPRRRVVGTFRQSPAHRAQSRLSGIWDKEIWKAWSNDHSIAERSKRSGREGVSRCHEGRWSKCWFNGEFGGVKTGFERQRKCNHVLEEQTDGCHDKDFWETRDRCRKRNRPEREKRVSRKYAEKDENGTRWSSQWVSIESRRVGKRSPADGKRESATLRQLRRGE